MVTSQKRRRFSAPRGTGPKAESNPPDAGGETNTESDLVVRVVRSARRKKTVSGWLVNWYTLEVLAPRDLPEDVLQRAIASLVEQVLRKRKASRSFRSDETLQKRATELNECLYGGVLRWRSIRFVANQTTCFGSCSPGRGTIRIARRLATVPAFVLDYVITHELAHLVEANHSPAFWELVYRYDKTERARGYLMALQIEDDAVETGASDS